MTLFEQQSRNRKTLTECIHKGQVWGRKKATIKNLSLYTRGGHTDDKRVLLLRMRLVTRSYAEQNLREMPSGCVIT